MPANSQYLFALYQLYAEPVPCAHPVIAPVVSTQSPQFAVPPLAPDEFTCVHVCQGLLIGFSPTLKNVPDLNVSAAAAASIGICVTILPLLASLSCKIFPT